MNSRIARASRKGGVGAVITVAVLIILPTSLFAANRGQSAAPNLPAQEGSSALSHQRTSGITEDGEEGDEADEHKAAAKSAKVKEPVARATALAVVPGAEVVAYELENEGGKLIYSYELKVKGRKGIEEVNVDAITGAVISKEHEGAKKEAQEQREEAAEH